MKKTVKIIACAALLGLTLITGEPARAYPADGYEIASYDVQAVVSENNVYDITETIRVRFTEQKHGIYRDIPVNTVMSRTSGGKKYETRVMSWVTDISVEGCEYSASRKNGLVSVRIGSADTLLTGDHTYQIRYKLHFGNDGVGAFDEAYYNIIGNDWTSATGVLTFSVTLPSGFDKEKLGFSIGQKGAKGYDPADLSFSVRGNTISGRVLRPLSAGEGVTVRLELPEGYFASGAYMPDYIFLGALALTVIAGTALFLRYGENRQPIKTAEFFPPESLTPAELGYVYNGYPHARYVISLIIYWADQGYLSIQPAGKGFLLTKKKPMDGSAKDYEQFMFDRLFKKKDEVKTQSLRNKFYGTINKVTKMIEKAYTSDETELFTKESVKVRPWLSFLSVLPISALMLVTMIRHLGLTGIVMGFLLAASLFGLVIYLIFLMRHWREKSHIKRLISLIVVLLIWAALFAVYMPLIIANTSTVALPVAAAASTAILALEAVFIRRRTPRGLELLGKIMGFADFIKRAERSRIAALAAQYPQYFYRILPYAYVLGISDKWAKNFEDIAIPEPDWYPGELHLYGDSHFSPSSFVSSFNSTMGSVQSQMSSSPGGGSSGGGSSGGGSSGGGGGGGGGGSW